eukprot:363015-Chlamydomonas_euryale.AAC.3
MPYPANCEPYKVHSSVPARSSSSKWLRLSQMQPGCVASCRPVIASLSGSAIVWKLGLSYHRPAVPLRSFSP